MISFNIFHLETLKFNQFNFKRNEEGDSMVLALQP